MKKILLLIFAGFTMLLFQNCSGLESASIDPSNPPSVITNPPDEPSNPEPPTTPEPPVVTPPTNPPVVTTPIDAVKLGMATPIDELTAHNDTALAAELDDYVNLGVKWVRIDFWWSKIQPNKNGSYNWNQTDRIVNALLARDIKVLAILNGRPSWVEHGYKKQDERVAFAAFSSACATRFKDKVLVWEIFNEPNMGENGQTVITSQNYTELLKLSYNAVKAVDQNNLVLTAGNASVPYNSDGSALAPSGHYSAVQYLKDIYTYGGKNYFDAVAHHPYTYPLMPTNEQDWSGWKMMKAGMRDTMVQNGDSNKKIWITEVGAPTSGGSSALTESDQAVNLQLVYDLAKATTWAGPILWYSYRDRGPDSWTGNTTESFFGLIRPDKSRKPAYNKFKELAAE